MDLGVVDADDQRIIALNTPLLHFEDNPVKGDYITLEKYFHAPTETSGPYEIPVDPYNYVFKPRGNEIYGASLNIAAYQWWLQSFTNPQELNFKIVDSIYIPKNTSQNEYAVSSGNLGDKTFVNLNTSNNIMVVKLDRDFPEQVTEPVPDYITGHEIEVEYPSGTNTFNVKTAIRNMTFSIKVDREVFTNLFLIQYKKIPSGLLQKETSVDLETTLFTGDTFNTLWSTYGQRLTDTDAFGLLISAESITTLIDTPINTGLRHGSKSVDIDNFYKPILGQSEFLSADETVDNYIGDYLAYRFYTPSGEVYNDGDAIAIYPQTHLYNYAYSKIGNLEIYSPLPLEHDFCSSCENSYPYRVYYSQADDTERRQDGYLTILPNNYKDIDGNSGPITDMFINFNDLYVGTPYAIHQLPINAQILTTNDGTNVFLGSGSVLSQPFRQIKNTDVPTGGYNFWKSRLSTDFGTLVVDDIAGRVYMLTRQLNDISSNGLRLFWRDNGTIQWLTQFKNITSEDYPNLCLANPNGVGLVSTYDPIHRRVLIHKRDYILKPEHAASFVYSPGASPSVDPGWIWYDDTDYYLKRSSGFSKIAFGDPRYFIDKSFTISYSLIKNC